MTILPNLVSLHIAARQSQRAKSRPYWFTNWSLNEIQDVLDGIAFIVHSIIHLMQ